MLNLVDLSRTDLNLLVLFEAVLEERHVGRAAERLNLTSSAVSHGLGRLRRLLNDPLFLRTPKGVVPTARALELAAPIADVLAGVRTILSAAEPFDPATSTRRFTIGAPDGISAVLLAPLLAELAHVAPGIDIGIRQLMPAPNESAPERAWRGAFADLDDRLTDIAVIPTGHIPERFHVSGLYDEDFVVAMRAGHTFAAAPTLARYCELEHLVVSLGGDPHGFVDEALARLGRARRVALTVPNFMFALAILAATDLICALPRRFAAMHAARFGVESVDAPLELTRFRINAILPKVALMDAGVAWLLAILEQAPPPLSPTARSSAGI
ncbi:LysR family transcriptional regulator [Rhizobium lentis]|uniref:LysR family transcriptional regulator n=1 Tax=Rhizobium lentis TaxID=1138194 RepID=UPI001C83D2A2|nr:LysR family transcriptional regulator [Rhizobium lentis]MBX5100331.1 LysR family transcriptional regulator [Rhizobium lentis]